MDKFLLKNIEVNSLLTLPKIEESFRVMKEILNNADDRSLTQIMNGYECDIETLFSNLFQETYETLFSQNAQKVGEINFSYLDSLNSIIEETFRIENLTYFISSVMPEFELSPHHLEWGDITMKRSKICVLCSRDGGKSFYYSNAYPAWKMYRYKPYSAADLAPRIDLSLSHRGFIFTNEISLGEDLLEILKETIESNDILNERLYPITKENWSKRSIKTKNGARLAVKSYGGSFRGRHPGWIVLDDYLRENILYSVTQRNKSNQYFKATIMNALLKKGQIIVIGTPMHEGDIYGLLKKTKGWIVLEYPIIFPDGTLLWEGRYNFNDIMDMYEEQGSMIFARERLVKPIMTDSSLFPDEILKSSKRGMEDFKLVNSREAYGKNFVYVVVGVDLAISASAGADFSVFTVFGVDARGDMWLMYCWRKKGASYGEQLRVLNAINVNFAPDIFCIESNQFQAVVGQDSEEMGLPVHLHNTGENKYNFKHGLPAMSLVFEKNKMHFPQGDKFSKTISDLALSEFGSIAWTDNGLQAVGNHDDIAMSIWKAYVGKQKVSGLSMIM